MTVTQRQPGAAPARVFFIQAGDYREAYERLAAGGAENYFAQRFTVDYVGRLRKATAGVAVLSHAPAPYTKLLGNGVLGLGLDLWGGDPADVLRAVEAFAPTHLILRVPLVPVLEWVHRHQVPTLALFAESFAPGDSGKQTWYAALRSALNQPVVRWIANHRVPAARSLAGIGVSARKIVPYDFETYDDQAPTAYPAKTAGPGQPVRLLYVGALRPEKGLPEAIRALRRLRDGGLDATLTIAGGGEVAGFEAQWCGLGLAGAVRFVGVLPNEQVIPVMREHDVVLVTSRHDYPEGFPLTITEALCARTPLVLSDHPMFGMGIAEGEGATFFRAGDATDLAARLAHLLGNPAAYGQLSERSLAALEKLHCPVTWGQVIDRFIGNAPADQDWFDANALAATHGPLL